MLTIVVTDSRGRHLDTVLDHEDILVSSHSGATLYTVTMRAIEIIHRYRPDVILIMAGINDITILNRHTRRVRLISTSTSVIISHLISEINRAKSLIAATSPSTKIVIGGIAGFDINVYNRRLGISPLQSVVDNAITATNSYIRQLNADSQVPHPRLTSKIHTWRRGRRKNFYSRLYDGLHPNNLVLNNWAHQIRIFHRKCILKFGSVN